MFHEVVDDGTTGATDADGDAMTAPALLASFEALVSEAAAEAGRDRIVDETGLDGTSVDVVDGGTGANGEGGGMADLSVTDGAAVVALIGDHDADAIVAELRDHLLMGMATAVLDVDTIAASIDADLTGQEVQQVLEGRAAMTLGQLAEIMAVIERRKR